MTSYPGYPATPEAPRAPSLGLALVVILNGVLLIRPEELYPEIEGIRLYYIVIVCCILFFASAIANEFSSHRIVQHSQLLFILGLMAAVFMSHMANFRLYDAYNDTQAFSKLAIYYILITLTINTASSLRLFLSCFIGLILIQTTLALLQYHGYIDNEALRPFMQKEVEADGNEVVFPRLCAVGIYNDPNDLCLLLTAGILIGLGRALNHGGFSRFLWLLPTGTFAYALTLTQSRGGMLAAASGLIGFFMARYGAKRAIPFLVLLAPIGLALIAGRQTRIDLSNKNDTSQHRIRLWSDGFEAIPTHPLFGIGSGQYTEEFGLVAHNSYVHAYVELGLFGGGLFLSSFLISAISVWKAVPSAVIPADDAKILSQIRPIIFGMLASYMAGIYSLSRNYIPPTYLNLALATAYVRLVAPEGINWLRFDLKMVIRVCAITIMGYIGLKVFILLFVRF